METASASDASYTANLDEEAYLALQLKTLLNHVWRSYGCLVCH